jgi:hypothetical protein
LKLFGLDLFAETVKKDSWKNRRRMAWGAFIAGLLYPLLVLLVDSEQLGTIAPHFYIFIGVVLTAYYGFATADDKWQRELDMQTSHHEEKVHESLNNSAPS